MISINTKPSSGPNKTSTITTSVGVLIYVVAFLQIISSVEKQIFDFLGYMWLPILCNFLNVVFVIFCTFGIWQRKYNYIVAYITWNLVFILWNIFLIVFYLEALNLKPYEDILSFGTKSFSWFLANGVGCNAEYFHNVTSIDDSTAYYPIRPSKVSGCLMEYQYVEALHAAIHLGLALVGMSLAVTFLVYIHREAREIEEELSRNIYSIEYSPQGGNDNLAQETQLYANLSDDVRPHMTPRRVKRRSYTRSSARSAKQTLNRNRRASTRSLGSLPKNKNFINPVNQLMMNQAPIHRSPDSSSTSNEDNIRRQNGYGHVNGAYESSRPNSIYSNNSRAIETSRPSSALTSYSNFHPQRKLPQTGNFNHANNNLTQESFGGATPKRFGPMVPMRGVSTTNTTTKTGNTDTISHPLQNHNGGGHLVNSSYDDLPPPPPPIAEDADALPHEVTSSQVPVPQQRNMISNRRNEYVNMPFNSSNEDQSSINNGFYSDFSNSNVQTLKAKGHLLNQATVGGDFVDGATSGAHLLNGHAKQPLSSPSPAPIHMNGHAHKMNGIPNRSLEDDYGFSMGSNSSGVVGGAMGGAPALPPKKIDDKWYLKDSMKPVGSSMHGGNCKCYRCQRKLTAI